MSNLPAKRQLPNIKEIYSESVELAKQNDLNIILNQPPKPDWLKEHPIAKKEITLEDGTKKKIPLKYIPIERVEYLLTTIFINWKVEILREGILANSAYVTVRLHYQNPITNEWEYQDGVGACPIQTDSGAGASDWQKVKSDGVMKALPAAESYAIKDAAEKLGKLFGKDLNRADGIGYDSLIGRFAAPIDEKMSILLAELTIKLKDFTNHDELKIKSNSIQNEFISKGLDANLTHGAIKNRLDELK